MMTESFKGFGRASGAMVALAIVLVTVVMGPVAAWAQQPAPAAPAATTAAPLRATTVRAAPARRSAT